MIPECEPGPCSNGECVGDDSAGGFDCACDPGFQGSACDKSCDLSSNRMDITILMDTSGSTIGNKQITLETFAADMVEMFDTQEQGRLIFYSYSLSLG